MKKAYLVLLLIFAGCSLFDSSSKRSGGDYVGIGLDGSPVAMDDTVSDERAKEIYDTVISSFEAVAENGNYKYGKKTIEKNFTKSAIKVLVGNCSSNSTKCTVTIFIDKVDQDLRPLFVIPTEPDIASCSTKFVAYANSLTTLAMEAIKPLQPYSYEHSALTEPNTVCSNLPVGRLDFLCRKKSKISSVQKQSSLSINYSVDNVFDVTLPASDYMLNVNYLTNNADNILCLQKIFRPSQWGKVRRDLIDGERKNIAVFKIVLKMAE